jgi:hypothetical protein
MVPGVAAGRVRPRRANVTGLGERGRRAPQPGTVSERADPRVEPEDDAMGASRPRVKRSAGWYYPISNTGNVKSSFTRSNPTFTGNPTLNSSCTIPRA